jgi:uncharacterized C2H2 Zn-finger protein
MDASILHEDLELFRRVMRVMKALEDGEMNLLGQPFSPPSNIGFHPGFNPDHPNYRLDTAPQDVAMEQDDGRADNVTMEYYDDEEEDEEYEEDDAEERAEGENEDDGDDDEDDEDDDCTESDDTSNYYEEPPISQCSDGALSSLRLPASSETFIASPAIEGSQNIEEHDGDADLRCWDHGCSGRKFTTRSNLKRHLKEKSEARPECRCPRCGAVFSRTTARNTHVARGSCNRIRRYSNGRIRPNVRTTDG